jgi:hypothetical protein
MTRWGDVKCICGTTFVFTRDPRPETRDPEQLPMISIKPYIRVFVLCLVCVVLDCLHFPLALRRLDVMNFCLCLVAFGIIAYERGPLLFGALLSGFLLDGMSHLPLHIALFGLYALAGKSLAKRFSSPLSLFHILTQLVIFMVIQFGLFFAEYYPFYYFAPRLELWAVAAAANAGLVLAAVLAHLLLGRPEARKFTVYKI